MRLAALARFALKSGAGEALVEARLGARGLEGDRGFALLDERGRALTQREAPLLATIGARLAAARLELDLGGLEALALEPGAFREPLSAQLWGRVLPAHAAPAAANARLASYLGRPATLVALAPGAAASMADAEPLLVVTLATLEALNGQLAAPVGIERFRANLVIEGAAALAERGWRTLEIGGALLECVAPCERCEIITIDQARGERRGPEPLATIAARMAQCFGVYCRVQRAATLRVGEAVRAR